MASNKSKSKRPPQSVGSGSPRSYSEVYKASAAGAYTTPAAGTASVSGSSVVAKSTAPSVRTSADVDWAGEYGYVVSDLRTLFLITGALVIGIIVAGFFL
jgi:hypothetical protein